MARSAKVAGDVARFMLVRTQVKFGKCVEEAIANSPYCRAVSGWSGLFTLGRCWQSMWGCMLGRLRPVGEGFERAGF